MITRRQMKNSKGEVVEDRTITEKVVNLTGAVFDWGLAGFPEASQAVQQEREQICLACEFWVQSHCVKCGCGRLKWKWATNSCPVGKWVAVPRRSVDKAL